MKVSILALIFTVTGTGPLLAAPFQSQLSGDWLDPTTWGGSLPGPNDTVTILNGHTVTVNGAAATAASVTVNGGGVLAFSRTVSSTLTVTAGDLRVVNGGRLEMGTAADPILPDVRAVLVLARGATPAQYRLILEPTATFETRGADKTAAALASSDALIGATGVQVPFSGWRSGDVITLGQTVRPNPWANQTEERVITSTSATGVSWLDPALPNNGGLDFNHVAADGFWVGNLTRNVVVRSSGTDLISDTANVESSITSVAGFRVALAEFVSLGDTNRGMTLLAGAAGSVSSCTFHHCRMGLDARVAAGPVTVQNSLFYRNEETGLAGERFTAVGNHAYAGNSDGFSALDSILRSNQAYSNDDQGFRVYGNVLLEGNDSWANNNDGYGFFGFAGLVRGNLSRKNRSGFVPTSSSGNLFFIGNVAAGGANRGFRVFSGSQDNVFFGDVSSGNAGVGVEVNTGGHVLLSPRSYGNSNSGLRINEGPRAVLADGLRLGYDASGTLMPNSAPVTLFGSTFAWECRGCRINPAEDVGSVPFAAPGRGFLSYNHNLSNPGTARVTGDWLVSGSTFTLDNVQHSYRSSARSPVLIRGTGHSASVVSTNDAGAVSQVIVIRYDGSQWVVEGSSTTLSPSTHPGDGSIVNYGQFQLQFTAGGSPQTDDVLAFALLCAAGDAGVQKRLLFADSAAAFNGGRSRLTVAPTGGLVLRGTPAEKALVNRSGSNYFTLLSSGTVTLEDAQVENTDSDGLKLTGTASASINATLFDNMGQTTTVGSYITAQDLTSVATFTAVTFGVSRPTTTFVAAYNVRVLGNDSGLNWAFAPGWGGGMSDAPNEFDPNDRVRWLDASAPATVGDLAAAPTGNYGEIRLNWTAPANDASGTRGLLPGTFLIFHSTDAAAAAGAAASQAQVSISTRAAAGSGQSYVLTNLALNVPVHFRLWTRDESLNVSGASNGASATETHPAPQAPASLTATGGVGQVTLSWPAASTPPPAYFRHYVVSSALSSGGPYVQVTTVSGTGYVHAPLLNETTYYYRVRTVDLGDSTSTTVAAGSARTLDVQPPEDVVTLFASPGDQTGEVRLQWFAPGDNLGAVDLPAGSGYGIQHALSGGVAWSTGSAQVNFSTGPVARGAPQTRVVGGLNPATTYYFRLWTRDPGGLWSGQSNLASARPRLSPPQALTFLPSQALGTPRNLSFPVSFNQAMNFGSVQAGVTVTPVRDRMGNDLTGQAAVVGNWTADPGNVFTFSAFLEGNTLYEVRVATTVLDAQGNAVPQESSGTFLTVLDRAQDNVVTEGTMGTRVAIPAFALAEDGYIQSDAVPAALSAAAAEKLSAAVGDPFRLMVPGTEVELNVLNEQGFLQPGAFAAPVTVTISYADVDDDGIVDGPVWVKARTLRVHWLDERTNTWERLPSSVVDTQAKTVSARTPHFTAFALFGGSATELTGAHASPNPWRPEDGVPVTFHGLGDVTTIGIYTPQGGLVKEWSVSDGLGVSTWDARDMDGAPAASGLYVYRLKSGDNTYVGKLMVIR